MKFDCYNFVRLKLVQYNDGPQASGPKSRNRSRDISTVISETVNLPRIAYVIRSQISIGLGNTWPFAISDRPWFIEVFQTW